MTIKTTGRALEVLAACAKALSTTAKTLNMTATHKQCRDIHRTLRGAIACLNDDAEYVDAAEAFANAASDQLIDAAALIGQARAQR